MNRFLMLIFTALFTITACSTPDGDDMAALEGAIDAAPKDTRDQLFQQAGHWATIEYLGKKNAGDIMKTECRSYSTRKHWTSWDEAPDALISLGEMIACMHGGMTYLQCADMFTGDRIPKYQALLKKEALSGEPSLKQDPMFKFECRGKWVPGFDPKEVPMDYNDYGSGKSNRMTTEDVAKWIIGLTKDEIEAHPVIMTALGVVLTWGVLVALPTSPIGMMLCPKSNAVLCPDDPGAPGVPQHGPDDGGDR